MLSNYFSTNFVVKTKTFLVWFDFEENKKWAANDLYIVLDKKSSDFQLYQVIEILFKGFNFD